MFLLCVLTNGTFVFLLSTSPRPPVPDEKAEFPGRTGVDQRKKKLSGAPFSPHTIAESKRTSTEDVAVVEERPLRRAGRDIQLILTSASSVFLSLSLFPSQSAEKNEQSSLDSP